MADVTLNAATGKSLSIEEQRLSDGHGRSITGERIQQVAPNQRSTRQKL